MIPSQRAAAVSTTGSVGAWYDMREGSAVILKSWNRTLHSTPLLPVQCTHRHAVGSYMYMVAIVLEARTVTGYDSSSDSHSIGIHLP